MLQVSTIEPDTLGLLRELQSLPCLQHTRLVGGTALALQLGHRLSIDLDLFGEVDVDKEQLIKELSTICPVEVLRDSRHIHQYVMNDVKVDIVNYRIPWLEDIVLSEGVRMASLEDICAMKLSAVTGRGTKKDFVDIFFLLKRYSLREMMNFYLQKYPNGSEVIVLKSLTYFEDAEKTPMPKMLQNVSWEAITNHINGLFE